MGRASVRAAIAAYFTPASLAGLTTTYAAPPKEIPAQAFGLSAGSGSGAVLIVHLTDEDESRIALGGAHDGGKFDTHHIAIELMFQSVKSDAIAAQADHDALIDAFMTLFRADRTLGTGGVPIFQAGEDSAGIKTMVVQPVLGKQNVILNSVIRFNALEFVEA